MSAGSPQGWATAPLDSLCQKFRGVSYGRDEASTVSKKDYVPILRANNLQNDHLVFNDLVWVPEKCVSEQQKLRTGDIVIAMSSGSKSVVGKTAQVMEDWQGSFGAFCGVLRPWSELNFRYVGLFLRTREYRNTISELAAGSNINNLKNEHLAAIEVPVAPLGEQRRIVAKLETLLGKVDACQQRLDKMPTLVKRFRQSVLAAACSGRLTADWREKNPQKDAGFVDGIESDELPEGWCMSTVEKLAKIGSGQSSKLIISKCEIAGEIPWFKVSDMNLDGNEKFMRTSQNYLSRDNVEALGMKIYPVGTIIFPKRGGAISTNKKRILIQPSCIDSNTMALTPHSCFGDYFWTWFTTKDLGILADGSSVPQINNPDIQPLEVPLPPLAEQQEIVRRVAGLFALADQLELRLAQARGQVAKLTPSLLARAFAGKLVPQNPADEPAEKLLERIRNAK